MAGVQLFADYPGARGRIPHIALCDLPTPVERLSLIAYPNAQLFVKRDDISAHGYGGNKTRKLEFLLGDAVAQGAKRVLTFGYAGSNFATATAIYSRLLGMRSYSMLLPQRVEPYVERNLRVSYAAGARLHLRSGVRSVAAAALVKSVSQVLVGRRRPYWIPAGGSSALGVMGFVNAGLELIAQSEAGQLPMPGRIYLPMGSMGSVVGLSLALRMRNISATVVAVRVIGDEHVNIKKFNALLKKSKTYIEQRVPEAEFANTDDSNVEWRDDYFGGGYGAVTDECAAAVDEMGTSAGLPLDTTYSGKAFACLLGDLESGEYAEVPLLFWNTHNSRDLGEWLDKTSRDDLPRPIRRYLDRHTEHDTSDNAVQAPVLPSAP